MISSRNVLSTRAETSIPNIRIFVQNIWTNIRSFSNECSFNLDSIRVNIIVSIFWSWWGSGEIFNHKIDFYELKFYNYILTILLLLTVTGNIHWLFPINFDKWGVNVCSSKRTNNRIFVCLEKGSFVTFRTLVSALLSTVLLG